MEPTVIVLIVVIVLLVFALAAAGVVLSRRRTSERLQEHYGPEYERSLAETGDKRAAEAQLTEREQRVSKLDIRDLTAPEREGFTASWVEIQRDFVDDPDRAVQAADDLVADIMRTRGFPAENDAADDAERLAEDISVEHPDVVARYREAREVRDATGDVDTDRRRDAVRSYRSLVEALLGHDTEALRHDTEAPVHDTGALKHDIEAPGHDTEAPKRDTEAREHHIDTADEGAHRNGRPHTTVTTSEEQTR